MRGIWLGFSQIAGIFLFICSDRSRVAEWDLFQNMLG